MTFTLSTCYIDKYHLIHNHHSYSSNNSITQSHKYKSRAVMGNDFSSLLGRRFQVSVTTGDLKGAGTNANVFLVLYDETGMASSSLKLDKAFHDDLERGRTDEYRGPRSDTDFGTVSEIEIWRDDAGLFSPWFCDLIVVKDNNTGQSQAFPVQRWIKAGVHYWIPAVHTTLPQDDKYKDIRTEELQDKRKEYVYALKIPGLPVQVGEKNSQFLYIYCIQNPLSDYNLLTTFVVELTLLWTNKSWN